MNNIGDLPTVLPIFPLPGAILLPRSRLPLHLFEPRYLTMLEDAMKTQGRLIGMLQPNPGRDDDPNGVYSIGCAGRLTQFSEAEDGRYMVTLTGISRFRVRDEVDGFSHYRRWNVTWDGLEKDRSGISES